MNSTDTGRSVTCSGVTMSVNGIGTGPAMGITANAVMAGTAITNGASMKTTRSAAFGVKSSLNINFMPSANDCSNPNGPFMVGPLRCCIRPTTRRSNQMVNSVMISKKANAKTALISTSHHGSAKNMLRSSGFMPSPPPGPAVRTMVTRSPAPAARCSETDNRGARVGTQTTPSTMPSTCRAGRVIEPRSLATVTLVRIPAARAVAGLSRATDGRAVLMRYGSPATPRLSSRASRQVASTTVCSPGTPGSATPTSGRGARSPVHGPSSASSAAASAAVRTPSGRPSPSARAASARRSVMVCALGRTAGNGRWRPSQLRK